MKRYIILDALRGFALMGIALANFQEFSLYVFQPDAVRAALSSGCLDRCCQALHLMLVDGKFYTVFSLLFGIGFSIILRNARAKGRSGMTIFYRRMTGLVIIGLLHLLLLWTGDILLLYALMGMLLPLFYGLSNRRLLQCAAFFLVLPVVVDTVAWIAGVDLSAGAYNTWLRWRDTVGINEQNFPVWLRNARNYTDVLKFVVTAAPERLYEFIDSNRYFKVLGLFLVGAFIGRNQVYARLEELRVVLRKMLAASLVLGVPTTVLYVSVGMGWIDAVKPLHTAVYTISVYPMGVAYCCIMCLLYLRCKTARVWTVLSFPGRMALTNYLMQSVCGIVIFYGVGFGFGAGVSLAVAMAVGLAVFAAQCLASGLWLKVFAYGPTEWIWRMWTHGKRLPLIKPKSDLE